MEIQATCLKRRRRHQAWKLEDQIPTNGAHYRILQGPAWTRRDLQGIGAATTDQRGGLNSRDWIRDPHLAIANPRRPLGLQSPLPGLAVHALLQHWLIANSFNHKFHACVATAQAQVHQALALSSDCPSTSKPEHHITLSECKAAN
jgi:hypothetical protein